MKVCETTLSDLEWLPQFWLDDDSFSFSDMIDFSYRENFSSDHPIKGEENGE